MANEADRAAIYQHREAYNGTLKAGDLEGWLDTLTDDCVFLPPGAPPMNGKDAVRMWVKEAIFQVFDAELEYDFEELEFVGASAFGWGWFRQTLRPKDGSEPMKVNGKFLDVFKKTEAGEWKLARAAYSSDTE